MNYNEKFPTFSFRLTLENKKRLDKIASEKKTNSNEIARRIIASYLTGELVDNKKSLSQELEELKVEKLKQEIRYLKIKNDFAETFDAPMPVNQQRMLKPAIIKTSENEFQLSPYDASNKRLQCTECGALFTWNSVEAYLEALKEYPLHIRSRHGRELNEVERNTIDDIQYEGHSK